MAKISYPIPQPIIEHIIDAWKNRTTQAIDDFASLNMFLRSNKEVPDGHWHKKFKTFILMGEGNLPKTIFNHTMNIDPESQEIY